MCTLTCSSGFFASDKGLGTQLNLRLVRDVLVFYHEGDHSEAVFTLPLLHAESVQQAVSSPLPSITVVLQSQFRQCVIEVHSSKTPSSPVTRFTCITLLSHRRLPPTSGAKNSVTGLMLAHGH
jgi:hypothetical protein